VNDLPGALTQIKNVLVPDGLFIGTIFGGDTLCVATLHRPRAPLPALGAWT